MIFDHIGLFVPNLEKGRTHLSRILPITGWGQEIQDPGLKVQVQFGTDVSGVRYELVAPFGEGNPVSGVLASGKGILNHVAYRVTDLPVELARLRAARALPIGDPQPAVAFDGARVAFFLTPLGFIVELIEAPALTS